MNMRFRITLLVLSAISIHLNPVFGHIRWKCPVPRNPDTGIKYGPCGDETNQFLPNATLVIGPGPFTVQWEESITHVGAPFRIALSSDGRDTDSTLSKTCVLLDHIPHNDLTNPIYFNESTYGLYTLTIDIPDVSCERCSLHIANPMTDKFSSAGTPTGIGCTDPNGTCGTSVYHSCTVPIQITGRTPRKDFVCPTTNPSDWPTQWKGDNGVAVDATTRGVYRRESGVWKNGFLMDVPSHYRTFVSSANRNCLNRNSVDPSTPAAPPVPAPAGTPRRGILLSLLDWIRSFFHPCFNPAFLQIKFLLIFCVSGNGKI
jgi:hypothetical protein